MKSNLQFAFELKDGTIICGKACAHFDLLGQIPENIYSHIVNSGFVENGEYRRGGDFSQGIKAGESAIDYYYGSEAGHIAWMEAN